MWHGMHVSYDGVHVSYDGVAWQECVMTDDKRHLDTKKSYEARTSAGVRGGGVGGKNAGAKRLIQEQQENGIKRAPLSIDELLAAGQHSHPVLLLPLTLHRVLALTLAVRVLESSHLPSYRVLTIPPTPTSHRLYRQARCFTA